MKKKYRPKRTPPLEINVQHLDQIVEKACETPLTHEEGDVLRTSIHAMAARLRRQYHPRTSEKATALLEEMAEGSPGEEQSEAGSEGTETQPAQEKKPRRGHGRNGSAAYKAAKVVTIPHPDLAARCPCPDCHKGRLYDLKEAAGGALRITGMAPIQATVYKRPPLRCNTCGRIFRAELPPEIGTETYDPSVPAMIAQLRYGSGMPFYRIEKLQAQMGIPLPAGTQFDLVEAAAEKLKPAHDELERQAAQGSVLYHDDTGVLILDEITVPEGHDEERTGLHTTGLVSEVEGHRIAVFTSGPSHAGENLGEVLKQREDGLPPPTVMNDALNHNTSKLPPDLEAVLGNCLVHGRRQYTDIFESFPEACKHVIEQLGLVYKYDAQARERGLDAEARLAWHQQMSGPVMDALKKWMESKRDDPLVEPNSGLGKANRYFLKRWDRLTAFLRHPSAPLDNTVAERALKKAVLHRKNSLFYKTENGARVGDLFMSLIHTCELNKINPFQYLTELLRHAEEVRRDPAAWMPWNFHLRLPPVPD